MVSIPVKLYSVAKEHVLGFRTLCDKCNSPITMRRWCANCKKEVSWEHVVKGLELERGRYFVITQKALKALKPIKTSTIAIQTFVDIDLIDPVYFNTHYYLAPADALKAYSLFNYALGSSGKVAIGSFVMRDREHVCMLQSYHAGLLLTTLYYSYEVRPVKNVPQLQDKQPVVSSAELKLAKQLIEQLSQDTFDMKDYKDTFAQDLKKLIKQKKSKVVDIQQVEKKRKSKKAEPSLMEALKTSLQEEKKHARR